ncbi:MAG TPA: alpha/beta hydrolase [Polyangia bacterium]|nr:alpha/beta hydrolase [Polyangia bacterium]
MHQKEGYAIGRDGSPIYYRLRGAEAAPVVALCDGIGCDGYVWKYLEGRLVEGGYRIVHWNYRGHGRTPVPLDPHRVAVADLADDLAAVLSTVGVERATLCGHSMGVQVCLETFRRHHTRTAALMFLCGSYGNPLRTFRGKRTLEAALPFVRILAHTLPRATRGFWRHMIPTELAFVIAKTVEVNPDLIRREDFFPYLEGISRVDPFLFLEMLANAGRHTAREILPQIDVPTLVVAGDRDGFTPVALSRSMAEAIPQAELLVVEGGSHTAPIERPELVCDTVLEFLSRRVAKPAVRPKSVAG